MPIHSTAAAFHDSSVPATDDLLRTAACGYVIPEGYSPHVIWTPAELSRREDVTSWDDGDGTALRQLYSRLCAACFPWARDPDFIKGLQS